MSVGNNALEKLSPEKIAIIDWTHLIEDYLDNIGVSFEDFKNEMTGGWLFGYVETLQSVGFAPVFFCFSANSKIWGVYEHLPTKSEIRVLPSPKIYRWLRTKILNPYALNLEQAVGNLTNFNRPFYSFLFNFAEYFSTPLLNLRKELKKENITKIISQEYESGRFDELIFLAKLTNKKIYATFQGGAESESKIKNYVRQLSVRKCNGLIIGSEAEITRTQKKYGLDDKKIAKIFNPLATVENLEIDKSAARENYKIPLDAKVAVWHGRIDLHRKGLDLILKTWKNLLEKNPNYQCQLLLLGDGNDAQEFAQLIDSYGFTNVKWFREFTNDRRKINDFLSLGDVYLFASRHEGFPVAPIEAMSLGLPLLATNVSGVSDILPNGEDSGGIIVEIGDVHSLADNLGKLFEDDNYRQVLAKKAKQRARTAFSVAEVGKQLEQFINKNE